MKAREAWAEEKFWPHVSVRDSALCWPWLGNKNDGYGYEHFEGRTLKAHRISAILHGLEVPPRMHVDHICRNRACINPAHLRVVTPAQNTLENSVAVTALNAAKTHCVHGHQLTEGNLTANALKKGWRSCAECTRRRNKASKSRARALASAPASG